MVLMKKSNAFKERPGEAEFLQNYDITKYNRPSYTADVLAVRGEEILLIQRGNHPYKHHWALVGGFVEMEEDVPAAAERELWEETGLTVDAIEELGTYGTPGRDPRGRIISTAYVAKTSGQANAGDDAAKTEWFRVEITEEADELTLLLQGEETLSVKAIVKVRPFSKEKYCEKLLYSDLAFDHGKIVVDGLLALRRWENEKQ